MDISLPAGKYLVAVSGGVDSVVLLDLLSRLPDIELVVAHFDHGIRPDSEADRRFVQQLAEAAGLEFRYAQVRLGPDASEATARTARYAFLRSTQKEVGGRAIITAHHQDDVLETAILNIIRGTGRKGLTALKSTDDFVRPLLDVPKADILAYARSNKLTWHEDSTNQDPKYLRNYIRLQLLPRFDANARARLLKLIRDTRSINEQLDHLLGQELAAHTVAGLDRQRFTALPHNVSKELLAAWLRANNLREFDSKTLERLTVTAKTARPGTTANVYKNNIIRVGKNDLALTTFER